MTQPMTLAELKEKLNALPPEADALTVKVWMPGSRVLMCGTPTVMHVPLPGAKDRIREHVMIEGYLENGSVLLELRAEPVH
jgi:hypothetical protein